MTIKSTLLTFCLFFSFVIKAQDSIAPITVPEEQKATKKLLNHEIGFNTVTLLSQLSFFEPSQNQQLYTVFYNIYYKDLIGLRLGGGMFSNSNQSEPRGEILPTINNNSGLNLRAGVSYNFISHKRFTFNVFGDYLYGNQFSESRTTSTLQTHPDPFLIVTNRQVSETYSHGLQAGIGIKVQLHKILCLYAELPVGYLLTKTDLENVRSDNGGGYDSNKVINWQSNTRITLPSTVYLVLRF